MTNITDAINTKAVDFLKTFRESGAINIVAIHPVSSMVAALTCDINSDDLYRFIATHNGDRNLYFTVNEVFPDTGDRKPNKLDIAKINAVWVDADPDKSADFDRERERLHLFADELSKSDHPPTYIIDSGGGIQAFWLLKNPVPKTDDIRKHYESLNRGLASKYQTDPVHNIDRLMRIPFTMNLPTKNKQGRKPMLAKVYWAASKKGVRYDNT